MTSKNDKILLINPWIYDFAAYDFWIKPLGLLSIGGVLANYGYEIELIDCLDRFHMVYGEKYSRHQLNKKNGTGKFRRQPVDKPVFLANIPRTYARYGMPIDLFRTLIDSIAIPDVILVTSAMSYWYLGPFKAIELLKEKFPGVPVILGGIYATLFPEHAREYSGADFVIEGAGERKALTKVAELTGRSIDMSSFPIQWARLPLPDFQHYPNLASVALMTSKGCPYNCSFCASRAISGDFEQRPAEHIIEQIDSYARSRHVTHFAFFDDALLIDADNHLLPILEAVRDRQLKVQFHTPNGIHAKEITAEIARLMHATDFKTIRLSYESSDKGRQREMSYKVTDESLAVALDHLETAGYNRKDIDVYVIMGLPDQDIAEVVRSMLFVTSLGAKVRLTSFSPIPGTRDWERSIIQCGFPADADPILTNNSIFPLHLFDGKQHNFQQIRYLSKVLNYSLDQNINLFDHSDLANLIKKILLTKFNA
ncbi:radical SAM protein [candidate division KSB1 bacterium]|nr:radical SAM protein [candidate division KSB1 bacterium]